MMNGMNMKKMASMMGGDPSMKIEIEPMEKESEGVDEKEIMMNALQETEDMIMNSLLPAIQKIKQMEGNEYE